MGRLVPAATRVAWPVFGALVALVPALWMWGFTVDDALISVRYAQHLASGLGWRFNAHGPSTDGVTPLPWPLLLAPWTHGGDALAVLGRAKALGVASWTAAGAALGASVGRARAAPRWVRVAALGVLGLSVPVAAYAVSGMETAVAMALATAAVLARGPRRASLLAGLAASLRPEMSPWACVLGVGLALAQRPRRPDAEVEAMRCGALSLAPVAGCTLLRALVWGHLVPLAVAAKPSDFRHGLAYAEAACAVVVTPVLVVAPRALRRCPAALVVVLAALVHALTVIAVGGDWMPYARLMAPVAPSLVWASVLAAERSFAAERNRRSGVAVAALPAIRTAVAIGWGAFLVVRGGTRGRHVGADREALISSAKPWLAGPHRVASLDIGWVGAATDADIIDLAGVTDPEVAALPGGHTSKRVSAAYLLARDPDALLLYLPAGLPGGSLRAWPHARYARSVEARLAHDDTLVRRFYPVRWLPLGVRGAGYLLLRARPD